MKIADFKLERYFAQHEFTAKYLLSSSDCDGFELKYVLACASQTEMDLWESMKLGYTESEGNALLREAISQFYINKTNNNIVVASPGELNFISMNVLLDPADHVVIVSPCYQSLYEVVKSIGCEISYWKPDAENWNFNTEDLEKLIKKNTKLIILNFPHNPTGSYLTINQLQEIVSIATKHNLYIFSDEMYHKLVIDDIQELPPICDIYKKGITLWGTSKTFGLAGLRIGWLVSQDKKFLQSVLSFKDYLSICNNAPSEILAMIALNHIDKFLLPNMNKIKVNIGLFDIFYTKHKEIGSFVAPKAGSTAFVKLNIPNSSLDFCNRLVKEAGIMALPSEMFEHEGKYIRVGFGRNNFSEVLGKFGEYLSRKK